MLRECPIRIVGLDEFPRMPEPVEDAETFEGNARLKAIHYARCSNGWALADDSGLEVDALGGQPGVRSARFAGDVRDDGANNAKVVRLLRGVADAARGARFVCVMALADRDGVKATSSGVVAGRMIDEPRGENGFGYDPHFLVESEGMTAAELGAERKNEISHRGTALRGLLAEIQRLVAG